MSVYGSLSVGGNSKHMKGSKERYLLPPKPLQILGVIAFVKLQNDT